MDTSTTARLALPLLVAGQAHKEVFHNEALTTLDFLVHPVVKAIENDPVNLEPAEGDCWLVGTSPVGSWSDRADQMAGWTGGGWRFFGPFERLEIYISDEQRKAVFIAGVWQSSASIAEPSGGGVIDSESRVVIDSILSALRAHGVLPPQP